MRAERKEREFNFRRAAILEQAEKIFSAKGYYNVTMAEIAEASGFAIGSLYQFFESKEDLYSSMILEKFDLMNAAIRQEVNVAKDVAGKIEALIATQLQFVEKNADFCRIFLRGQSDALSEKMTTLNQKIIDGYFDNVMFIENILKAGIKSGVLRKVPTHDAASALFHLNRSVTIEWLLKPTKESLVSKKDFILDIFFNGVKNYEQ